MMRPAADAPPGNVAEDLSMLGTALARAPMRERAMDVHAVQGLAAALVLGPRLVSPGLWMNWVWDREHGTRSPEFTDLDDANRVLGMLMVVYNDVATKLGPGSADGEPFEPAFASAAAQAAASFCAGFRCGMALAPDDWLPLQAEQPDWIAAFADPAPDPAHIASLLPHLRRYWRGRTDKLPPLRNTDLWGEMLDVFEYPEPPFPHEAVATANRHRELLAPRFLQALEEAIHDTEEVIDSGTSMPIFAMIFLGVWRDTRAWRPLLALARLSEPELDELFGDTLTETYGRALASVCDGDMAPLVELLRDETVNVWVRVALLNCWTVRVCEGDADAGPLEAMALELAQRDAAHVVSPRDPYADPLLMDEIADVAIRISSQRLAAAVRDWFERGLLDVQRMRREEFEQEFARPLADKLAQLRQPRHGYLRDVAEEAGWWATFDPEEHARASAPAHAPTTYVRAEPKIGRNDPCPCGSGRKYKKCHGAN